MKVKISRFQFKMFSKNKVSIKSFFKQLFTHKKYAISCKKCINLVPKKLTCTCQFASVLSDSLQPYGL